MSKTALPIAWLLSAVAAFAPVTPVSLTFTDPAFAHDWYPMECCHGMDCAPVDKVEVLPGAAMATFGLAPQTGPSEMLVTTRHGTVLVPADFPRRESKDNRMHVCMRPTGNGGMRLLCIFMPPST
jgi:hypothetical protein